MVTPDCADWRVLGCSLQIRAPCDLKAQQMCFLRQKCKCKSLLSSTETYSFLYIFNCATYVGKMLLDKSKACPQTRPPDYRKWEKRRYWGLCPKV